LVFFAFDSKAKAKAKAKEEIEEEKIPILCFYAHNLLSLTLPSF